MTGEAAESVAGVVAGTDGVVGKGGGGPGGGVEAKTAAEAHTGGKAATVAGVAARSL